MSAAGATATCGAALFIGDDFGDNSATMRCQLTEGHDDVLHVERFSRGEHEIVVTWPHDERERCKVHGLQPGADCEPCWADQDELRELADKLRELREQDVEKTK